MMYIVEKFRSLLGRRLEAQSRDPREQNVFIVGIINRTASILGMNVYSKNFSPANLHLRLMLLNVFVFFCINVYNMWINYGNLVDFMYCLETLLYVFIACIKINVFLKQREIAKLQRFIAEFYERFRGDVEQEQLTTGTLRNTFTLMVLFSFCSTSAAVLIFMYSLIWSCAVEYALPFGFLIPTVGIENLQEFIINYAFQLFETFLMVVGILSSESAFFMYLLHGCLQIDMLLLELDRLAKLSASNSDGQHTAEIRSRIQMIIRDHIAHQDFTNSMCNLFELHFFIVFGCIFCQLICIVVVVVTVPDWYPGYFLFAMLTFQLFFNSALGQMFDIKCDELTVAIYNVPWYNMEPQEQKALQLLLLASQHPGHISYGFGTVNMRAFFEIYRKTYSIGMMLISANEGE